MLRFLRGATGRANSAAASAITCSKSAYQKGNITQFKRDYQHGQTRGGVADTLMGMATKQVDNSREKQFKTMIEEMANTKNWTLKPWRASLEVQLNSWGMYVPGVATSPEILEVKKYKEILDFMTVQEIENPELLTGPTREKIAKLSGRTLDDVTKLVFVYKQSLVVHTWLQEKKKAFEVLPTTQTELMAMQAADPRLRAIGARIMTPKTKRTGRGKGTGF